MMGFRDIKAPEAPRVSWPLGTMAIIFLPAFFLFCLGAMTDMTLPGVYMDAVNPDYFVVRMLSPAAAHLQGWFLPGTVLFGRFPVVGQIYHGALPYYIGLPFYALFGTGVVGIRLTNMVFGLLVLGGAGAFMWAAGTRAVICSLCLALLALDPGFLFSFRTQFYITLLPIAALFASAALVEARRENPGRWAVLVAGCLAGLSCYGYFIYAFLVPAVAALALYRWHRLSTLTLLCWPFGFLLGVLPYAVGVIGMFIAMGSPHAFIVFLINYLHTLGAQNSPQSLHQRAHFFLFLVHNTIIDLGPSLMMLHSVTQLVMPGWKSALLLWLPAIAIASGVLRPRRVAGLLTLLGILTGFLVLVMVFGSRLWLHHAALLIPLFYAGVALALERIASLLAPERPGLAGLACVVIVAPFLIANAADRQAVFLQLETTGGTGLASDAITRFAEDTLRQEPTGHVFLPDWGVFMSFAMITRGTIPYTTDFTPAAARAVLCAGTDAEVLTMDTQPPKRVADWTAAVHWPKSETIPYTQRDGTPLFIVTRWRAADRVSGSCP